MTDYDSHGATLLHIMRVSALMQRFASVLIRRGDKHDASKLEEPEKSFFDQYTPLLSRLEYGSDEYKAALRELRPALDHHYRNNRHHPEHFPNGVSDMNLFDILEMLADWKAASERAEDGSMEQSLEVNFKRFDISRELALVIANTAEDLGWIEHR